MGGKVNIVPRNWQARTPWTPDWVIWTPPATLVLKLVLCAFISTPSPKPCLIITCVFPKGRSRFFVRKRETYFLLLILLLFWGGVGQNHVDFLFAIFVLVSLGVRGVRHRVRTQQRFVEQITLFRLSRDLDFWISNSWVQSVGGWMWLPKIYVHS